MVAYYLNLIAAVVPVMLMIFGIIFDNMLLLLVLTGLDLWFLKLAAVLIADEVVALVFKVVQSVPNTH